MARVALCEAVVRAGEPVDVDAALDGVPEDAAPRARVPAHPEPALARLVELLGESIAGRDSEGLEFRQRIFINSNNLQLPNRM